jgi:hypothetical protein
MIYRTGRKNHRTIYAQAGADPADTDEQVGTMDTPELGRLVVAALNGRCQPNYGHHVNPHRGCVLR